MFHRLRQICLVAQDLDPVVAELCDVFDVAVCHRDPEVGMFGLHNALMPLGHGFLEVVAPLAPGRAAAAERHLARRGGDGGYMVITDTDDLARWEPHLAATGVRIAAPLEMGAYRGLQLHPRDTGGALLEINTTRGNTGPDGAAIDDPYGPAGPDWRAHLRTGTVTGITGARLQAADPERLGRRWAEILRRDLRPDSDGPDSDGSDGGSFVLDLDNARIRFEPDRDGRGEGLGGVDLAVADADGLRRRAAARFLPVADDHVVIGGLRFHIGG
ncbi:VOC family protein [Tistrella mobilis]|uniref:VOC family protein n=1 Tax=Tistrella mobilis TaxID=171437 RepID=UPI0035586AE6